MSDITNAQLSGQGVGTSAAPVSSEGQSLNAVAPQQEQAGQNESEAPKYVTAAELAAMEERIRREVQSKVDKSSAKVQERLRQFDEFVATSKALGRELPQNEVDALRVKAYEQAVRETADEPAETNMQPDMWNPQTWNPDDPVTHKVIQLQQKYGLALRGDMPEAQTIDRSDAFAFVMSYEAALKAAKDRQSASANNPTNPTPPAPPAARMPSQGAQATPHLSPDEKIRLGLRGGK